MEAACKAFGFAFYQKRRTWTWVAERFIEHRSNMRDLVRTCHSQAWLVSQSPVVGNFCPQEDLRCSKTYAGLVLDVQLTGRLHTG